MAKSFKLSLALPNSLGIGQLFGQIRRASNWQ